jgi:hypothetical protein
MHFVRANRPKFISAPCREGLSLGDRRYVTAFSGFPEIAAANSHDKTNQSESDAGVDSNSSDSKWRMSLATLVT